MHHCHNHPFIEDYSLAGSRDGAQLVFVNKKYENHDGKEKNEVSNISLDWITLITFFILIFGHVQRELSPPSHS